MSRPKMVRDLEEFSMYSVVLFIKELMTVSSGKNSTSVAPFDIVVIGNRLSFWQDTLTSSLEK